MSVETVEELFTKHMPDRLKAKPELCEQINASYKFDVSGDKGGMWRIDLTKPGGEITSDAGEAQCTISIKDTDLLDVINGEVSGQMAFMTGKLQVQGDMMLAMKLGTLLGN